MMILTPSQTVYSSVTIIGNPPILLLKLNRSIDVSTVLANRAETLQGITIKPDQTNEEGQRELFLLGEC